MESNLVTIAQFQQPEEAEVTRELLDSSGIECHVKEDNPVQVFGPTNLVAGIKLQVRAEDEQAAREILASYSGGNAEAAPETKFEK